MKLALFAPALVAVSLALAPHANAAIVVDGRLDPDYGVSLATQATQTQARDDTYGLIDGSNGSELDAAHGFVADGVLHLFLAGNLMTNWCGVDLCSITDDLTILFDTKPGGQNPIRTDNPSIPGTPAMMFLSGMALDTDFVPDYWIDCRGNGYPISPYYLSVAYAELPAGGGGAAYMVGNAAAGGPGTLSGGSNPYGLMASIDNRNAAGVTYGCAASSGTGVMTGIELAIPLAALGNPAGCIKVSAFVFLGSRVTNQVLGPVPPGTCNFGNANTVDFSAVSGNQYFSVCPPATPVHATTWGRLQAIYR